MTKNSHNQTSLAPSMAEQQEKLHWSFWLGVTFFVLGNISKHEFQAAIRPKF